ncbi:MAG TPA: hypothetical protein VF504_05045, partial [Solirubrobacterales bacterium]
MSGTRFGIGRVVALGVLLALSMLLLAASKADAGKYAVAQCGWYVGADAAWADTTGGLKFRPDAYCVPPAGADPFAGAHLKSFTRDGQATVSGTRFAGWRWTAPPGTRLTQVRGTWWHVLHDGIEQRLGAINFGGGFEPFLQAAATDTAPQEFTRGFPIGAAAFEDRLLCARAETKSCSLEPGSWSALRALTLTVEDPNPPTAVYVFGELLNPGWHRGVESVHVADYDVGGGVRYAETKLDGIRVALTEFPCAKASIGGQWRATQMQPCPAGITTVHSVATASFADGPHNLVTCAIDFADNGNCAAPRGILVDNNAPVHPRAVSLAGGEGWRRLNDFDLGWENPDQGQGSPLGGASWRIVGPGGFDTGVKVAPGRDRKSLPNLSVPTSGVYALQLWLRDEAGNEAPASAVTVPLRFDDLRPSVGFAVDAPETQVKAEVFDEHSGPTSGQLLYRRIDAQEWIELPAKLVRGESADRARL